MAIKTFSSGEVLTAADTNTYLNNGGLVYVTTATASNTAAALNITSCFSATYDNYRIEITNIRSSSAANISWQLLNGSTPVTTGTYNYAYVGISSLNASTNTFGASQTSCFICGISSTTDTGNSVVFDILNPFLARRTVALGNSINLNGGLNGFDIRNGGGNHESPASYDGIRLLTSSGNITFTARVYGYRQA